MQTATTTPENLTQAAKKNTLPGTKKKLWFYIAIMVFPVIQFIVFYIMVNFNSILLAFKEYEYLEGGVIVEKFVWFDNIINTFKELFTKEAFLYCWKNSFIFYGVTTISGTICSLSFSYYIYKKGLLGDFFKIMLYMPHIVSGMVITILYTYFLENGWPLVTEQLFGQSAPRFGSDFQYFYILFYVFVMSFGANMLVYTGTMAGISDSIIEAGQIDGANRFQEFFHIIMPSIFSTFALFIVTGMITIFNGQGNLFNFFGVDNCPSEFKTFGYYMYVEIYHAKMDYTKFTSLAALGMCLTLIAIPLIFTLRALLEKYGPKDE